MKDNERQEDFVDLKSDDENEVKEPTQEDEFVFSDEENATEETSDETTLDQSWDEDSDAYIVEEDTPEIGIPEELKKTPEVILPPEVKETKEKKKKKKKEKAKDKKKKSFKLPLKSKGQKETSSVKLGRHSIKFQVVAMLLSAVILPMIIISVAVYSNVSQNNKDDINDSSMIIVNQSALLIEEKTTAFMEGLSTTFSDLVEARFRGGDVAGHYKSILKRYKNSSDYIYEAYIVMNDGTTHSSSGITSEIDEEVVERQWYIDAWDRSLDVTEPVKEYNRLVYRVTKKMTLDGEPALFVAEINVSDILAFANDLTVLEEGYAIVTSRDGLILFHPNIDMIGEYIPENLYEQLDIEKEKINPAERDEELIRENAAFYEWDGTNEDYFANYTQNLNTGWVVITTFNLEEIAGKIRPLLTSIALIVILVMVGFSIVGYIFANRITRPLNRLIDSMKQVENGDLSVEFTTSSKTEVKVLGDSFNVMIRQLRSIITNLTDTFDSIQTFVDTLSLTVEQTTIASNEISKSMLSVAEGAEAQAVNTNESVDMIADMDTKIIAVNDSALEIKTSSNDAIGLNNKGLELVGDLKSISELNLEKTDLVTKNMSSLSERVTKINDIIKLINDISRQTNLLALNASIEAARAGEHGRGFAVVANEVSKLAEETSQAVHGIDDLLKAILSDVETASSSIDTMQDIASKQSDQVAASTTIFEDISSWIEEIVVKVDNIESDLQAAVESKDVVANSINVISEVAQDSSAVSEEVSAATEEQLASLEQLDSNTRELNDMVQKMNKEISDQFKL